MNGVLSRPINTPAYCYPAFRGFRKIHDLVNSEMTLSQAHCFPEGRHLIFYTITKRGIDIIGIPHQGMDIIGYFEGEP
jgi:hypothetical protein